MRLVESELDQLVSRMPPRWALVKSPEEFWGDLATHGRALLKSLLEGTMELWRDEWVEVEWHQPAARRRDHRNGYYRRKRWPTALGLLHDVRVPRCRQPGLSRRMFQRLEQHRAAVGDSVVEMLLAGVSTRRVGELLERLIGLSVSPGQVSQLAKRLDAQARVFHTRPLEDQYAYLLLDAIHLKARGAPRLLANGLRRTRKRVVLVAYGITHAGRREIIDFRIAAAEDEAGWTTFLTQLQRRGLSGRRLQLITTDGGGGLLRAVQNVYGFVLRQRCWFHKMQNVAGHVRERDRAAILQDLRPVYAAPTRRAAERAWAEWACRWRERYPKAVACVELDLEELLAVYTLPEPHRRMVRTTNPIERRFREVRRRTRPIGTFVNDASIDRIIFGLVSYFNTKYAARVCPAFRKTKATA